MTRRRLRLTGVALALLALSGAYVAGHAGFAAADHDVFSVHQGGQCYEVAPLGSGDRSVEEFYDYRRGAGMQYSSYGTTHLQANQVSQLFVYRGSAGTSLVMLHDQLGGEGGGAITFHVRGLPTGGDWAVVDDTYNESDDRFSSWDGGADIDWMWSDNRTDGAAFRGIESHDYDAITIEPRFNGDSWAGSEREPRWDHADDQVSWQLRDADGSTVSLDRSSPVTVEPGPCQVETTTSTTTVTTTTGTTTTETTTTGTTQTTETTTVTTTTENTTTQTTTQTTTTEDDDDGNSGGGASGGGGGGSGGQDHSYDSGNSGNSQQETRPEMSVDVEQPDDDTALVEVSDPAAEDGVSIEPLVADDSVAYESFSLSFDATEDFGMNLRASETVPPGAVSPSPDRDGFAALSYLSVDRAGLPAANVSEAEITFAVEEPTLDERGVAPEEVSVYRRADGEWHHVPTERIGEEGDSYEYVARSSNLTSVVVAANRSSLAVVDVTVAGESIQAGTEAEIRATVENTGHAAGTATADLTAFGTEVDTGHVRVPAGETRTLVFDQRFDSPGEYTVAVDGIETEVVVEGTPTPTATPTPDATTGPGQPGFGFRSAVLMMLLIGPVVAYGLRDVV